MPAEGRDLSSRQASKVARDGRLGNLTTPLSVQKLQTALHAKAKAQREFRFYALYDAVRRVYIKKPNGKLRPLGIPTLRDRVCQTAAMLVLEPIFEADLPPEQHAYRADTGALDAVRQVHRLINTGHREVVDADLSGHFDSIPHAELMQSVARRVYADDLVICCHRGAHEALAGMPSLIQRLKLTVNEDKTRLCRVPQDSFDILGYAFGRCYSPKTGRAYIGSKPSKKSVKRLIESIGTLTERRHFHHEATGLVAAINRKLTGWAKYFCLGPVRKAYSAIDAYTSRRLRQWLCGKHRHRGRGYPRYPAHYLYEQLSLVRLSMRTQGLPWAKA